MNESIGVKKDVELSSRQEYLDSFFSLIPEAMNYMTSQNLELAINSLEKALKRVKKNEEAERARIEREKREKEQQKRLEALQRAEAERRKEAERLENLHVQKVSSMDLPDDWTNCFSYDEVITTTSVYEALDNSIEKTGDVNIEYIAASTGKSINDVISSLSELIIRNPEVWNKCFYKGWEMREDYLSGSLTQKLKIAKEANNKYKGYFKRNVDELEKVVPSFSSKDIYITLSSPWVPCEIIDDFIKYLFFRECEFDFDVANTINTRHDDLSGTWKIENKNLLRKSKYQGQFRGFLFESFGTSRMDALTLLENTLNMKTIKIVDKMEDPSGVRKEISIMNRNETLKILEKQEKLIKEFKDWVWQDEKRMNTLISSYKETNAYGFCVKKHYDGSRLKFPGLNPNVNLYQHQRDAVKRIISSPNTLFLDEAHNYKNISYRSRITGVLGAGGMGSERADGMLDKVQFIQRNNNV